MRQSGCCFKAEGSPDFAQENGFSKSSVIVSYNKRDMALWFVQYDFCFAIRKRYCTRHSVLVNSIRVANIQVRQHCDNVLHNDLYYNTIFDRLEHTRGRRGIYLLFYV